MSWLTNKLKNEDGLLILVLAVIGAVALVIYVAHRI